MHRRNRCSVWVFEAILGSSEVAFLWKAWRAYSTVGHGRRKLGQEHRDGSLTPCSLYTGVMICSDRTDLAIHDLMPLLMCVLAPGDESLPNDTKIWLRECLPCQ